MPDCQSTKSLIDNKDIIIILNLYSAFHCEVSQRHYLLTGIFEVECSCCLQNPWVWVWALKWTDLGVMLLGWLKQNLKLSTAALLSICKARLHPLPTDVTKVTKHSIFIWNRYRDRMGTRVTQIFFGGPAQFCSKWSARSLTSSMLTRRRILANTALKREKVTCVPPLPLHPHEKLVKNSAYNPSKFNEI